MQFERILYRDLKRMMASLLFLFRPVAKCKNSFIKMYPTTSNKNHKKASLVHTLIIIVLIVCLISGIYLNFYIDPFDFDKYECATSNQAYDYEYIDFDEEEIKEKHNQIEMCLNKVTYENEVAVWSLLSDDHLKYAVGAVKLLRSLEAHVIQKTFDANILELVEKPLETRVRT